MENLFKGNGVRLMQIGLRAGSGKDQYKVFRSSNLNHGLFVFKNGMTQTFPTRRMGMYHYKWFKDLMYICPDCGVHYKAKTLKNTYLCTDLGCSNYATKKERSVLTDIKD